MTPAQRTSLRQSLRHTRRLLSPRQQRDAAIALHHALAGQRFFRSAKRLAFYQAIDGEIDPSLLLAEAQSRGQACFLPLLHPFRHGCLLFVRYREGDPLQPNRWGIAQPRLLAHRLVSPRWLDVVLVPLVGFDADGNRLGMGKGFYDRTFGFRARTARRRPWLIGLAHECQRVEALQRQAWDVPMDAIVSEQRCYRWRR
jgi:5-formyltetrahydrofolate cyclo-ligase